MKLSTDKILTTHAGSLPRGEPLSSLLIDDEDGKRIDPKKIDEVAGERVAYVMEKEPQASIDIANDAEFAEKVEQHVDALNRALEGIPTDRVRAACVLG